MIATTTRTNRIVGAHCEASSWDKHPSRKDRRRMHKRSRKAVRRALQEVAR